MFSLLGQIVGISSRWPRSVLHRVMKGMDSLIVDGPAPPGVLMLAAANRKSWEREGKQTQHEQYEGASRQSCSKQDK